MAEAVLSEAVLSAGEPTRLAKRVIAQGLTVRDVEKIAQREAEGDAPAPKAKAEKDADTRALEKALSDVLGMAVSIDHRGAGGSMAIKYRSLEQLDALCKRLRGNG